MLKELITMPGTIQNKHKRKIRIRRIILFSLIFIFLLAYYPLLRHFSVFLAKTERVNANALLVEGWLGKLSLEKVRREFEDHDYEYIITTGNILPGRYEMDQNGYLIFNLTGLDTADMQEASHNLSVDAWSSLGGKNAAHFNFWINDSLVNSFLTKKRHRRYEVSWYGSLPDIDSVMIQFDNDKAVWGDRNLYVGGLTIDHMYFSPYSLDVDYDISHLDGIRREKRNSKSWAGQARLTLINMGVDPDKIIAVPGYTTNINKTYRSVEAFRYWLNKYGTSKIKGINVISLGDHSRRTWLTYKKVLNNEIPVGIIALPDPYHELNHLRGIYYVSRQVFAYLYYKYLLLPVKSFLEPDNPQASSPGIKD